MNSDPETSPPRQQGPTPTDRVFLIFLVALAICVIGVGRLIYIEGQKNEVSKANADAWSTWFTQASTERFAPDYALPDCAAGPRADASPATWGPCLAALTAPGGPLALLRNPFTQQAPALVDKCEHSNKALAGALVLEKRVPTPPGSPLPVAISALTEHDRIEEKMQLRVTYCDMGAYAGRSVEIDF